MNELKEEYGCSRYREAHIPRPWGMRDHGGLEYGGEKQEEVTLCSLLRPHCLDRIEAQ